MTTLIQFQLKTRQSAFAGTLFFLVAFLIGFGPEKANAQSNDLCSGAIPVTCGSVTAGSTVGAGADDAPFCGTNNGTGGGVWYSFEGTGDVITLTTCSANTNYDTKIRVYTGSCASLVCVGGNDDMGSSACSYSGFNSRVVFISQVGTTYLILVHGYSVYEGDFELSVDCAPLPPNDLCSGAIPVTCGSVTAGSTVSVGADDAPFCGTSNGTGGGVWYSFEGTGAEITLTTCSANTDYDTKIRVYTGSCASLVCVGGNDDMGPACSYSSYHSRVAFTSQVGTTYLILVHGYSSGEGDFELSVSGSNADTDGDGTADCADGCPLDPNKTEAGACGCGVADTDTDGDGTADCVDTDDDNDGCPDASDAHPLVYSADADCDGVHNDCDHCSGGDDNGPCNATSLPPLNTLPSYWLCGNNNDKVKVCHNGNTLCINTGSVADHLAHGDFLGPCVSCQENAPPPGGSGNASSSARLATAAGFELFPNPASSSVAIVLEDVEGAASLSVFDAMGREVLQRQVEAGVVRLELDLPQAQFPVGQYFVRLRTGVEVLTRVLAIER